MESNDSPEIPDRGETPDIPGLPSEVMQIDSTLIFSSRSVLPEELRRHAVSRKKLNEETIS